MHEKRAGIPPCIFVTCSVSHHTRPQRQLFPLLSTGRAPCTPSMLGHQLIQLVPIVIAAALDLHGVISGNEAAYVSDRTIWWW